jgi:hypothetical protein
MVEAKKKLRRKCDHCKVVGTVGRDVFWTIDPYDQDVNGEDCRRWLHNDCAKDIAMDI